MIDLAVATGAGVLAVSSLTYCDRHTCESGGTAYLGLGLSALAIAAGASAVYGLYQVAACHSVPERSQEAQGSTTWVPAPRPGDEDAARLAARLRASQNRTASLIQSDPAPSR